MCQGSWACWCVLQEVPAEDQEIGVEQDTPNPESEDGTTPPRQPSGGTLRSPSLSVNGQPPDLQPRRQSARGADAV